MKIQVELLINQFLRSYLETFSIEEFVAFIKECGVKTNEKECVEYLDSNINVFALKNGRYATRAAVFTKQYFSFKPNRKEIEQGLFITGHRCIPFIDPEILSFGVNFIYKGKLLDKKIGTFDSQTVLDLFSLYGDEYSSQYIASDPVNSDIDLGKSDFILPPVVKITGNSLAPLIEDGFKAGDRIICFVSDWDSNTVAIEFESRSSSGLQMTEEDVERGEWYANLESDLNDSFDLHGPLSSIEEQLATVFANRRRVLCKKSCGSLDEFFARTNKVGFELFGVETRLWHKGVDVPAIGKWNSFDLNPNEYDDDDDYVYERQGEAIEPIPQYITDSFLKDYLFNKNPEIAEILPRLYPNFHRLTKFQQNFMLLHLKNRHVIISSNYNHFADSEISELRHKALELFAHVNSLVYSIDMVKSDLTNYPQQSLVILSQIFGHVMHILEMCQTDVAAVIQERHEILLSIEGMELNFECVDEDLKSVLERESKNGFVIIK
ncbi:MAG: hypothetical protein II367_00210 [Treponema sp.]|nr:hypothetical protein [Treponema sp.]